MSRQPLPTPDAVVIDGQLQLGNFAEPFARVNALDARVGGSWPHPRFWKAARLKQWQAVQVGDERFFAIVALFDARLLGLVRIDCYDRELGRKHSFERKVPSWSLQVPSGVLDSEARYEGAGCRVQMRNQWKAGRIELDVALDPTGGHPGLQARVTARTEGQAPLVSCMPFGGGRGMVAHKALLPAEGELRLGERALTFESSRGHLLLDEHRGFYPWEMRWDWVTGAGHDAEGRLVGFNLTRNDSTEPERYNENAFWRGGELHLLPAVTFDREPVADGAERWRVRDAAGRIDVCFDVQVDSRVEVNALVVRSRYRGPFGRFSGRLVDDQGAELVLDGLFGMGEQFYLRV